MKKLNQDLIGKILLKIKKNRKYETISDKIITPEIIAYLKSNPRAKDDKQTIKEIRARLHRLYSSYQTKKKRKSHKYLQELQDAVKNKQDLKDINRKLLSMTLSTKERLEDYSHLYENIFQITGKPKVIVDLAAGFNPLSFPLMNLSSLSYYAYDIDEKDIEFLNKYFKIMKPLGLKGKAAILDLNNIKNISKLPSSDIIFLFKVIDLLDKKKKTISEELIMKLLPKTKFIIASFATKTLTRKPMNLPRRRGFELMLRRNNLMFKTIKLSNEIFYVIY
jgi:hypothetical protein